MFKKGKFSADFPFFMLFKKIIITPDRNNMLTAGIMRSGSVSSLYSNS